ncbi:lipid A deacylase LpxR family protein [Actomonas aquatica]|uniref:Lipid A deacylase LpxR family protein n=1 Tax=Actomonas aquatica TaxID=2866162 RepID=A0ABZ1CE52_9BACT|nr:lipid A deacylase LpxR family protein [Opitutus sp. WL0086]WRQ89954.1 lipid A deacylase LpxR family protein [Opitutus sp. WL0086]
MSICPQFLSSTSIRVRRVLTTSALVLGAATATSSASAQVTDADLDRPPTTQLRTADGVPTRLARQSPVLIAYIENDYFGGTDQNYTNGFKLSWLSADLSEWDRSGWQQTFIEALPFINKAGTQKNIGVGFGQHIYTPEDISRPNPDPLDRPYAGWAYFEFSFLAKTDRVADNITVQLGMVGPHSYADDIQTFYHELIDDELPMGWDYQIGDELGVNLAWERKWRFYARTVTAADRWGFRSNPFSTKADQDRARWGFDAIPHIGAVVGNVKTYANAGLTVRAGYNLPSDFGVALMRPAGLAASPVDDLDPRVRGAGWSFFAFGGVDGRAVARDIFLDGNTFKDSRSVDKKNFVADFTYGFGIVRNSFQLTFTRVVRTKEYETQVGSNSDFGSVTTSWTF